MKKGLSFVFLIQAFLSGVVSSPLASLFEEVDNNKLSSQTATPFLEVLRISYTGDELTEDVPGWTLLHSQRGEIGLNAVAYLSNTEDPTLLITYRGTTSFNDECADAELWPSSANKPEKKLCEAIFSPFKLNYILQAKLFITKVITMIPEDEANSLQIVFSGHSLGAALAELMAIQFNLAAFVISSPGIKHLLPILQEKETIRMTDGVYHQIVHLYNPFDPVAALNLQDQIGKNCAIQEEKEPDVCEPCFDDHEKCKRCMKETHLLFHYLDFFKDHKVALLKCS